MSLETKELQVYSVVWSPGVCKSDSSRW